MIIHNDGEQSRIDFAAIWAKVFIEKIDNIGEGDMCETKVRFDRTKE